MARTKRGRGSGLGDLGRELASYAMYRAVGIENTNFGNFVSGTRKLPRRVQINFSKFIADWERGLLEFGYEGNKRVLIRRDTPRPMPMRAHVEIGPAGPKLLLHARPRARESLPPFRAPTLDKLKKPGA